MSLPPFSPKVLREIANGTLDSRGKKKVTIEQLNAKREGQRAKYKEALTAAEYRDRTAIKTFDAVCGKRAKGTKRSPRAIAKDRAWTQFSMFIRLRDSGPDGYGQCCTCPRNAHWRTMDAGHYITRAKEATLFDEHNVSLQCKGCNRFQGGKPLEHEQHIIRKYGPDEPQRIKTKAVTECKRELWHYQFIEDTYRQRVELIRSTEPGKFKTS